MRKVLTPLLTTLTFLAPAAAFAQGIPIPTSGQTLTLSKIVQLVNDVVNVFVTIAGLAVVGFIVYAGFRMVTSRGNDTEFGAAKKMLYNAVIGAVVIFGVAIIVNTIASFAQRPTSIIR